MTSGKLYIISAPSGAGKTSLVRALLGTLPHLQFSISYTTRPQREGEQDGVDYHFIAPETFKKMIDQQAFLEYANVFGHFYGTSRKDTETLLNQGVDLVLEIDWQGAQQVRRSSLNTISIFIVPPSKEALRERILGRKKDDLSIIEKRLKVASEEISHYNEYEYLIVNDHFDTALVQLTAIVQAERCRTDVCSEAVCHLLTTLMRG